MADIAPDYQVSACDEADRILVIIHKKKVGLLDDLPYINVEIVDIDAENDIERQAGILTRANGLDLLEFLGYVGQIRAHKDVKMYQ